MEQLRSDSQVQSSFPSTPNLNSPGVEKRLMFVSVYMPFKVDVKDPTTIAFLEKGKYKLNVV